MSTAKSRPDSVTPETDPQALVGTTIRGRYRVEALIGTGGMGAVYRVMHTGIDKHMALKVLSARMMKNRTVVARFEREAKAAANFGHPHVAAATDYGRTEDGQFFLVLEYIEGMELRQAMDDVNGPLPPVRAFYIARQIASALSRAHKLGIVHRDLKPENIMLVRREGQDDFVKVLDFGLALISRHLNVDEDEEQRAMTAPKITAVGEIFGTPSYMAPEQTVGAATDTRTDLYALGILLYEMLTGVRPFVGKNPVALIQQQLVTPPPPMKERVPSAKVAADMEALVMRLLAKQPAERYQTPEDLIAAIDQIGATHSLSWPGSSSPTVPAIPAATPGAGPTTPTLGQHLATVRKRLSGSLERIRMRLFATPERRPQRLRLLIIGVGVVLAVLVGIIWQVRKQPDDVSPPPTTDAVEPAPTLQDKTPQNPTDPAPTRRGGKHRQNRGERR